MRLHFRPTIFSSALLLAFNSSNLLAAGTSSQQSRRPLAKAEERLAVLDRACPFYLQTFMELCGLN
jgi:hypothetical protein